MGQKTDLEKFFQDHPALVDFEKSAYWLAFRGWSEAAGGNMSVRLEMTPPKSDQPYQSLPFEVPELAGMGLFLTGSGTRAREIGQDAAPHVGLYQIGADGSSYRWLCGNDKPTLELPAHCAIHNELAKCRPQDKAIVHTHPARVIALCHQKELDNGPAITDAILRLQSEARLILSEGIGFVRHALPGSLELGRQSAAELIKHRLVLWQFHGCLASGETLAHAVDLMEVFEKSVQIYWQLRSAGIKPDGIPPSEIAATLAAFGVSEKM